MATKADIVSRKKTHCEAAVNQRIIGSIIIAATTTKIIGRQIILRNTVQRRKRTSSRAERRALKGVMSGKVEIYRAKIDELIKKNETSAKAIKIIIQMNFSSPEIAMPLVVTML